MAKQLPASPSDKKISELYRRIKEHSLILQPEFQRKFVWNSKHKESFIETILLGLPFPEIYIAQSGIDIEKISTQEVVVDGQQRLSTIVQYIDEPDDSRIFGKLVKKFKNLSKEEKEDFINYKVVIRDLVDVKPEIIKEIFKRINQTKYSLEQVEIHNAIYDGEYISTAKEILGQLDQSHIPIFSDSEMARMADLHFILLCMTTLENGGYFSYDREIEKYIITYNDEYPNLVKTRSTLLQAFNYVKELSIPTDSIWLRKSNFFTLIIELCNTSEININHLRDKLAVLEQSIQTNKDKPKDKNEFASYYAAMFTGTNSRQARIIRSEILKKHIS